jgi:ABC-type amino acid transport substrate-binding protein
VEYRTRRKWLAPGPKTITALVAGALLIAGLGLSLRQRYLIPPSRVWRIGFMNAPPHYVLRADGSPAGFVVEVVELAMLRRGLRYEWKWVPESPEQSFGDGTIDIFPDLTDLPSRRKQNIHFSAPWLQNDYSLLSLKSSGILKAADTAGRQVAYKGASFWKAWPSATCQAFDH